MTDAHWTKHKNGAFDTAANWSTGAVPTAGINVFLDAMGKPFTVTASGNEAIGDLAVAANATLSLKDGSANAQTFVVGAGEVEGAVSVSNAGKIAVGDNSSLQILAREGDHETYFINRGVITLNARSDNSFLDVQTFNGDGGGFVSLTGGGSIVMSDSALNGIVDTHAGQSENATLFNVDNTISGAGVIGDGGLANGVELSLQNGAAGVIDATGTKNALTLSAPSHYGFANVFNSGLLEATGKAGLNIAGTKVENYGAGRIFAADGSIVRLESATIDGGTLATVGSGIVLASGGSTIEGSRFSSTVTNAGVLQVLGETLYAQDHINNTGAIRLSDAVSAAVLEIKGAGATLSGGGSVVMTDFLGNAIQGDGGDAILINSDNLISGAGQIGGGGLILGNGASGVVDATGTYNSLKLYGAGQTFGNDGLIEATGKAGLEIAGIGLDQTADGTLSVAAGSVARLESAQVFVGSLTNAKGGQVIASGGSGVFDVAVDNQGLFSVVDGDTLTMIGSVVNGGTVSLTGTASAAHLNLAQGNLTLSGGGKLLLGEGGSIDSAAPGYTLTNVDNQNSRRRVLGKRRDEARQPGRRRDQGDRNQRADHRLRHRGQRRSPRGGRGRRCQRARGGDQHRPVAGGHRQHDEPDLGGEEQWPTDRQRRDPDRLSVGERDRIGGDRRRSARLHQGVQRKRDLHRRERNAGTGQVSGLRRPGQRLFHDRRHGARPRRHQVRQRGRSQLLRRLRGRHADRQRWRAHGAHRPHRRLHGRRVHRLQGRPRRRAGHGVGRHGGGRFANRWIRRRNGRHGRPGAAPASAAGGQAPALAALMITPRAAGS